MTEVSDSKRVHLLDNLKGLLIFLVVLGHSLEPYKSDYFLLHALYMFIYLFHMPAFVFISGYFSKDLDKSRNSAFKNFFIPFVVFNVFWNILAALFTQDFSQFTFTTPGWALWYLISMFFWRIFLKDLVKVRFIIPLSFIVGLGAGIFSEFSSVLSLSRTLVFFPFFLVGYFTSETKLFRLKRPSRLFSCCIITLALGFSVLITYYKVFPVEFLYGSDSFVSYTVPIWLGLLSRGLLYIIGFSFVFVLANTVTSKPSFFSKVGKNTFPIYILHTYLLCPLFVINHFIPYMWIRFLICLIGAIGITSALSTEKVTYYFEVVLKKITYLSLKP